MHFHSLIPVEHPSISKALIINSLTMQLVWQQGCKLLCMHFALAMLEAVPEPGRLAMLGVGLIIVAVVLRRILIRVHPALTTPLKANSQLDTSQNPPYRPAVPQ